MTIECTPAEFGKVFETHERGRWERVDQAVLAAAHEGARVIRSKVPIDTGALRRETTVVQEAGAMCDIVEDTPYAAAQEAGTAPFTPPIGPLVDWARRQAPNLGIDESQVWAVARGVQKKIAAVGITAKWHTRDAQPELVALLDAEIRKVLPSVD